MSVRAELLDQLNQAFLKAENLIHALEPGAGLSVDLCDGHLRWAKVDRKWGLYVNETPILQASVLLRIEASAALESLVGVVYEACAQDRQDIKMAISNVDAVVSRLESTDP